MICASIDIGTNTLLLLIAEVTNGKIVNVIEDEHQIARLGEGLENNKIISDNAILRATRILHEYRNIIESYNVELIRVSATSAMRDAKNSSEVKVLFESIIKSPIEIIAGIDEARISFIGTIEDSRIYSDIVLDIGGGSTEVIIGKNQEISYCQSLQIGAVRITEKYFPDFESKKTNQKIAREYIRYLFSQLNITKSNGNLIAVAGTPTTIAAIDLELPQYNAHLIHNHRISEERLKGIVEIFVNKTSTELVEQYNIHPNRADVILGGALILLEFLNYTGKSSFLVSCKGLRYGLILDMFKK
jgi:exopolyphosphatase / guanosine-5'-triphosphate,3'-diphosphate pyrophosphatase